MEGLYHHRLCVVCDGMVLCHLVESHFRERHHYRRILVRGVIHGDGGNERGGLCFDQQEQFCHDAIGRRVDLLLDRGLDLLRLHRRGTRSFHLDSGALVYTPASDPPGRL
mmetsp:Transcript_47843/g.55193  ORF Transcript_47843/g.55193 Transcript_47843/m.55193 type:complete len:110 (+) Transcript_47843:223-552(+)